VSAPSPRLVPAALIAAVVAISFAAIFFRLASPTPPLVSAGVRLLFAAGLLLPWTVRGLRAGRLSGPIGRAAVLGGLLYAAHFGSWVASLELTTIAASVTLVTATPLLLAGHGLITGQDRPSPRLWMALGLAVVGVTTIGGTDLGRGGDALLGDGLALLGCAAMAAYLIVVRRLGPELDVLAFAGVATGVGAAALLTSSVLLGQHPWPESQAAVGWLLLSALVPQLIGHNLLTWSLRHAKPTIVGMATVGEPVGASLLGYLVLGEAVGPAAAVGCAITIGAVVLALRSR
jgi:drug/metabolite transporter (DMT)-like permease